MPEYHRIRLIHRNQIPQPTDAGMVGGLATSSQLEF